MIKEHNDLDRLRQEGFWYADRRCRKLRMGGVPWTPKLGKLRKRIELHIGLIKRRKGQKVSSRKLRRLARRCGDAQATHCNLLQLHKQLSVLHREYSREKATAPEQRIKFLEERAEQLAKDNNSTAERQLKALTGREEQRKQAARLRRISGKPTRSGLTRLLKTHDDGQVEEITEKEPMERAALDEYQKRLHQTGPTPLMQQPLVEDVQFLGVGPHAAAILDGTYDIPADVDQHTREYLEHLRRPPDYHFQPPTPPWITTTDHVASWKRVKEYITPGPSGLTPAHFKASTHDPLLAAFDASMANFPYITGHPTARWKRGLDGLIPKKEGVEDVHLLRPILMFEVDANNNNKILGRSMMKHAEPRHWIAREQYGSRKDHSADEQALNKRLTFDLIRLDRINSVDTAVDLRSCYDLVVHSGASLAMQRMGAPEEPIVCMFTTLQGMTHTVKTIYGQSEQSFGGDLYAVQYEPHDFDSLHQPPQGLGQGNGNGPQTWAVVSTPVLEMMRTAGHGASFKLAISGGEIRLVGFAFVDDSDVIQTAATPDTSSWEIADQAQIGLNRFVGGVRATGGDPQPKKCWWYLIEFLWKDGLWSYVEDAPQEGDDSDDEDVMQMNVTDTSGNVQQIERLNPSVAKKTLGVWLAPDGNNRKAVSELRRISEEWADRVRSGHITREDAWIGLTQRIRKSLEYPMAALTLTEKECTYVEAPIFRHGLSRSGICKSFPRAVIQGPLRYQGLGVPSLYFHECRKHVELLVKHGPRGTVTGQLLRAIIEKHRVEIGIGGRFLEASYATYGSLATDTWIRHLWRFLSESKVTIEEDTPTLRLRREHDSFIIEAMANAGVSRGVLEAANRCRIFLRAVTLADICTGDGRQILYTAWLGKKDEDYTSPYRWPPQARPSSTDWAHWRRALRIAYTRSSNVYDRHVRVPLGEWIQMEATWRWFFSPGDSRVYRKGNGRWEFFQCHNRRSTRGHRRRFLRGGESMPPADLQPTRVTRDSRNRDAIYYSGSSPVSLPPPVLPPTTVIERIRSRPPSQSWANRKVATDDNALYVAQAIRDGDAIAVSDGSYKQERGTAAFTIRGKTEIHPVTGVNMVPGYYADHQSYRAELSGLYGVVCTVEDICLQHKITDGCIEIGCDGEQAVYKAFDTDRSLTPRSNDFDLLTAIRAKVKKSPLTWKYRWIKGHQDDNKWHPAARGGLDRWALLNIEMDHLAKLFWEETVSSPLPLQHRIHDEAWPVFINNCKISTKLPERLYQFYHGCRAQKYWVDTRKRFSEEGFRRIDWDIVESAARSLGIGRRRWLAKHTVGMCGVGKWKKRWNEQEDASCPLCDADEETAAHVVRCPGAVDAWTAALVKMIKWIEDNDGAPGIAAAVSYHMTAWHSRTVPPADVHYSSELREALAAQSIIGWGRLIEGCPAKEWRQVQQQYYDLSGTRRTGAKWIRRWIPQLLQVPQSLWQHRNDNVHVPEDVAQAREQLNRAVRHQFLRGREDMPAHHSSMFDGHLVQLLARQDLYKQHWLANVVAARERQSRRMGVGIQLTDERDIMKRWLKRVRPPDEDDNASRRKRRRRTNGQSRRANRRRGRAPAEAWWEQEPPEDAEEERQWELREEAAAEAALAEQDRNNS